MFGKWELGDIHGCLFIPQPQEVVDCFFFKVNLSLMKFYYLHIFFFFLLQPLVKEVWWPIVATH